MTRTKAHDLLLGFPRQPFDTAMRILHVSRSAETIRAFLIPTMNAQKSLGHEVFICARESQPAESLRQAGFKVYTHRLRRTLNPLRIVEAIMVIRRVLIEERIDL